MKRILVLFLALALLIGTMAGCGKKEPSTPNGGDTNSTTSKPAASGLVSKVGDTASFGTYNGQSIEWQTLAVDTSDKEHQRALLISKDGLVLMPFNPVEGEEITWEKATLRIWLNGEFYNAAFTDEQKARILETDISTPANAESGAVDTSKTKDKVFILSADECKQYFANDEAMAASYSGEDVAWWTRTPGNDLSGRVCTYAIGGGLYMTGNQNHTADGAAVRPAIWVDITSAEDSNGNANGNSDNNGSGGNGNGWTNNGETGTGTSNNNGGDNGDNSDNAQGTINVAFNYIDGDGDGGAEKQILIGLDPSVSLHFSEVKITTADGKVFDSDFFVQQVNWSEENTHTIALSKSVTEPITVTVTLDKTGYTITPASREITLIPRTDLD
jgi:predicted small lipoprotein YifL